jgi:hypothetical protein
VSVEVRIYSYNGLIVAPVAAGGSNRPNSDSLFLLKQPYLGGEVLAADSVAVTSAEATAPTGTSLLQVQLQPNKSVYYEITPQNHPLRPATTSSPVLRNDTYLHFNPGYRISLLEKAE